LNDRPTGGRNATLRHHAVVLRRRCIVSTENLIRQ